MRIPNASYAAQPWRLREIAADFEVEDVWVLPTPGGPDDLDRLVRQLSGADQAPAGDGQRHGGVGGPLTRALFAIRWKLGAVFGWDKPDTGVCARVPSLRDRLPADLLAGPRGPDFRAVPFDAVYQTHDEYVAELANQTVHTLMHLGWVADGSGGHHGQLAALVKPNGQFGRLYMSAIRPVRRMLVYPALMRDIGRQWQQHTSQRDRPTSE